MLLELRLRPYHVWWNILSEVDLTELKADHDAVFWALGRGEVSDESVVDSVGGALAQVLASME